MSSIILCTAASELSLAFLHLFSRNQDGWKGRQRPGEVVQFVQQWLRIELRQFLLVWILGERPRVRSSTLTKDISCRLLNHLSPSPKEHNTAHLQQ